MPVNEKVLLERFSMIEAALSVLARECREAKKELNHVPQLNTKRADLIRRAEVACIKREKALLRPTTRNLNIK